MTLSEKRNATIENLRQLETQHRQIAVEIERHIGRIATLNELITESQAPTEGQGEGDAPGTTP